MSDEQQPIGGPPTTPPQPEQQPQPGQPLPSIELEWRRLHPLSPLLRGGLALIVIAGILIANLRDRIFELFIAEQFRDEYESGDFIDLVDYLIRQRLLIWGILAVLLVILVIVGISWLSWRFASFRITAEAVESRRGIVFKQHRRAPLDRIQSVNLQRSLLARLVGLTQLDVQTGGQGGTVALQYLGHNDAKQVREQILRAVAVSKATDTPKDPAQPVAVDPSGQVYATHAGAVDEHLRQIADFDIDPGAHETGSLIKVPVGRLIGSILLGSEMMITVVLIVGVLVGSIWGSPAALFGALPLVLILVSVIISQFNKGFNFVLSRSNDGVRVGAGLTSTTTETVPFGRIHAVEALQPLGWRPFGWWKVRITTAGHSLSQGGQNKLQNSVLPVGDVDDVLRVFETLLHSDDDGTATRAEALRGALLDKDPTGFLRAGPRSGWVLWLGKRRAGLRIEHVGGPQATLRIRRGWFSRSLIDMPVLRAQSIQLHRPLVHRMLGLASLAAHTVLGPVVVRMRGIALADAQQAFDVLASTVVRVQSEDAEQRAAATQPPVLLPAVPPQQVPSDQPATPPQPVAPPQPEALP